MREVEPLEGARGLIVELAVTLITGGCCEQELRDAGAAAVYESVEELRRNLDGPPFV
jgi:hypothetical protein